QVEDQYAGMTVRCPKCGNLIQMAAAASAPPAPPAQGAPPPATPRPPPPTPSPAAAPGPAGPGFMETIQQSAASFGLDALSVNLLYAGVGCLAGMVLFTFLPWFTISSPIAIGPIVSGSILGISLWPGILNFLLSAGAIAFLIVVFAVVKKKDTFDVSLWVAGGWSAVAALWRLGQTINYGQFTGFGLILALLASLGAAGTFGFVI